MVVLVAVVVGMALEVVVEMVVVVVVVVVAIWESCNGKISRKQYRERGTEGLHQAKVNSEWGSGGSSRNSGGSSGNSSGGGGSCCRCCCNSVWVGSVVATVQSGYNKGSNSRAVVTIVKEIVVE